MASDASDKTANYVTVKTTLPTLPLPTNATRPTLTTERLVIRPLQPSDVHALHILRTQAAVMINTGQGRPDTDLAETQKRLDPYLSPRDAQTFNYAICLRDQPDTLIGIGGCHRLSGDFGWPAVGYMIRQEHWDRGLTTEFLRAWLALWAGLPREAAEIRVDPRTVPAEVLAPGGAGDAAPTEPPVVLEQLAALVVGDNFPSLKIMVKCGFEAFASRTEPDLRDPTVNVELIGFRLYQHPEHQ